MGVGKLHNPQDVLAAETQSGTGEHLGFAIAVFSALAALLAFLVWKYWIGYRGYQDEVNLIRGVLVS